MNKYIEADRLRAEIDKRYAEYRAKMKTDDFTYYEGMADALDHFEQYIDSLQQEQPEVDLEKLGEIARHIIAVKQNVEDMRLNEDEWSLLERIGYPHKLNARKEDKYMNIKEQIRAEKATIERAESHLESVLLNFLDVDTVKWIIKDFKKAMEEE